MAKLIFASEELAMPFGARCCSRSMGVAMREV